MVLKYCPRCQREVTAIRPDIDACLLFFLLFTGIGWIIYLIIYFSQPESRCIICHAAVVDRAPNAPMVQPYYQPAYSAAPQPAYSAAPQQNIRTVKPIKIEQSQPVVELKY